MRILPCLLDTRIRYEPPFNNPYHLLKAAALKRGYRCMEGFIAKSPKVESLNTNPEGKIYPILSHARGTEVHLQMTHLARQVYLGAIEKAESRTAQVRLEIQARYQGREEDFLGRRASLSRACLLCGRPVIDAQGVAAGRLLR